MDIATIFGLILGFSLIGVAILLGGDGGLLPFIDIASGMIVFGGAFAALLINFPLKSVLSGISVTLKCFLFKIPDPVGVITEFKEMAQIVRKDGLLAIEEKAGAISDGFMRRGVESLIGGAASDQIRLALETELACIEMRHTQGKKMMDACGAAAPAFGMIGTLIGLVQMLRALDDPSKIGGGMATALLTTLYGALIANVICIPLAGKLEARSKEEILVREMMITGIVGLAEGATPRSMEEQLLNYLSPKSRGQVASEAA